MEIFRTYLKINLSLIDPADDHISSGHPTVFGESKPDVSQRAHLQFESDVLGTGRERPEYPVVRTEHRGMRPSNRPRTMSHTQHTEHHKK